MAKKKNEVVLDKRVLEVILADQLEELEARRSETYCRRPEQDLIDMNSPQAQVVIGVRRCGKSTLCFQALEAAGVKYGYVTSTMSDWRVYNPPNSTTYLKSSTSFTASSTTCLWMRSKTWMDGICS